MYTGEQITTEQLMAAVEEFFGFVPPFFLPAQSNPHVLHNLLQQTLSAYIKNPLPLVFKEKLFAYLSRYCSASYSIVCHSCALRPLGMTAREVLDLLRMPPLTDIEIEQHIMTLAAEPGLLTSWPQPNTALEKSLLLTSIYLFTQPAQAERCRAALLRLLGTVNYNYLLEFLLYITTCHFWIETHPELSFEADQRAQENLAALLADEPALADLFDNYNATINHENSSRKQAIEECKQAKQALQESKENLRQAKELEASFLIERERLIQERTAAQANELALREANRRVNEFMGIASHELKTPLTTIKGYIQLVARRLRNSSKALKDDEGQKQVLEGAGELLERTDVQIGRLGRLVNELLDVSRIQANKLELHLEPCDLAVLVHEAVQDQQQEFPQRTITLEMPTERSVPVIVDVDRIGQVLSNYLSNALKYSQVNQPVHVRLQVEDESATVFVHDEGPGLSSADQQHIWERFYRVQGIEVQSGSGVGLGLGLYICRTIIERHSGRVGVESTRGVGSTFWFSLHLAKNYKE